MFHGTRIIQHGPKDHLDKAKTQILKQHGFSQVVMREATTDHVRTDCIQVSH